MTSFTPTIDVIPSEIVLYIILQLEINDLSHIAQVSRKFNKLIEKHRKCFYRKENFDTLMIKGDVPGIRWLARRHPERKCPPKIFDWVSKNGYIDIIKLLLESNKPCTDWALNYASMNDHTKVVRLLLAANKPCNEYALDCASKNGHIEIVRLLVEANKPCTEDALDWASEYGHLEVVKILLAAGSPYSDCTSRALDHASQFGYTEIVKLLLEAGSPYTISAFIFDCYGYVEIVKLLLENCPRGNSLYWETLKTKIKCRISLYNTDLNFCCRFSFLLLIGIISIKIIEYAY